MAKVQVKLLLAEANYLISRLGSFETFLKSVENNPNVTNVILKKLELRLEQFSLINKSYADVTTQLSAHSVNDQSLMTVEDFDDQYFDLKTTASLLLESQKSTNNIKIVNNSRGLGSNVKLPQITLPTFSGNYVDFKGYYDSFVALVHNNNNLSPIEKFIYLKSSLDHSAQRLVSDIQMSNENYDMALEILRERYDNPKLIVQSHIKAIFDIKALPKDSASQIHKLYDELAKHIRALDNLNVPMSQCNAFISHILMAKLDIQTRTELSKLKPREIPSLADIEAFLKEKSQLVEELKDSHINSFKATKGKDQHVNQFPKLALVNASKPLSCTICSESHAIQNCPTFLAQSTQQRFDTIKRLNKCKNCLGHPSNSKCNSRYSCKQCHKRHHSLLHFEQASGDESPQANQVETAPGPTSTERAQVSLACCGNSCQVLLSTARVKVKDSKGKWISARAILDTGSMNCFITVSLLKTLNLKQERVNTVISGINDATNHQVNAAAKIHISSMSNSYRDKVVCLVIPKITANLPSVSFNSSCLDIPSNLELADNGYNKSAPIDLLLGVSIFYDLLCIGQISLGKNKPTLQKTLLGWIVSGNVITNNSSNKAIIPNISVSNLAISNEQLDKDLSKFWQLEEVKPKNKLSLLSKEERFCEMHFERTVTRNLSGRFSVCIPFNSQLEKLGDSRSHAMDRFLKLEKRLARNHELRSNYSEFIHEYISLGHMSKIDISNKHLPSNNHVIRAMNSEIPLSNLPRYYLPNHAVIKTSSLTTKLRVVFDGSAKSSSGISLNNTQLVGPVVQNDLFFILLGFRQYCVALTGDIAKMYRQIEIDPKERKFQCILWRDCADDPIDTYELNTVTYGTASASYLATRCLTHLAELNVKMFPKAAKVLKTKFYVDDLLISLPSSGEVQQIKSELSSILASAGFPIRKFLSNCPDILKNDDCDDSYHTIPLGERESVKALGVSWNAISDTLQFEIKSSDNLEIITKRSVLSITSQLFDPLGLLAPITIRAKILIQKLWEANLDWDESLPQKFHSEWEVFRSELSLLSSLKVPRCVIPVNSCSIQLHGFADSSSIAYGACIYVRLHTPSDKIITRLLCAKSRVAPLKGATIPRLELSAAVLLSELMQRVRTVFDGSYSETFLWTDSTIVLNWINSAPNKYKVFVANRIATIQEISNTRDWYHVRSQNNPADLVSRGITTQNIIANELWWNGPSILNEPQSEWSKTVWKSNSEATEMKSSCLLTSCTCLMNAVDSGVTSEDLDFALRFSSLSRLQRVTAWLLRFKDNCKVSKPMRNSGPLTVEELEQSLQSLVKNCQRKFFTKEIKSLQHHQCIQGKSNIIALNPFLDKNGVLRVGGRLKNSDFSYDKKFPMLLPKRHHLVDLILRDLHLKLQHCGALQLLYGVRENYWPISGKNSAKKIVLQCIKCFRANPSSYNPLMGNLPAKRLNAEAPAFYNTGLDYAGPILIRDRKTRNPQTLKSYICLFICLTTRAVHLELVTDLTTETFLAALKRFIGRRGMPYSLSSDNAKNFVGANNYLRELYDFLRVSTNSIHDYLAARGIKWEFIIPRNPHEGGMWESNIKSTKAHLKRVLGNTCLTYEQFSTVLVQIESVLNSRPLSPMSSDPNDIEPLTPGHFLIGRALNTFAERDLTNVLENRLSKYQQIQKITQDFWKRWSSEVVPNLQRRTKWFTHLPDLVQVNKLVLVKEDNIPPLSWVLGRVVSVHAGNDNVIRSASVRIKNGTVIKRSVTKLCALPL